MGSGGISFMDTWQTYACLFALHVLIPPTVWFDRRIREDYFMVSDSRKSLPRSFKPSISSSIIQHVEGLCNMGLALMAYFYCDPMDSEKQDVHRLLASLIAQLSAGSDAYYNILDTLYSRYKEGLRQ